MPEIHRNTPHVIPADAGNQRKTKHAIPPLRKAKGDASAARRGCPKFTATPPTSFPRTPFPPLRSAKGDASAASRGMPVIHPNTPHVIPADAGTQRKTKHAIPTTPPQKPNHQPVSQFVPQFKTKPCTSTYMVLPNCTSHFHLTATAMLY